jgi:GT2 family glycosyltransferase
VRPSLEGTWAVVVNWNGGAEANDACLASLLAAGLPPGRVVFVDNASSDGSREAMAAAYPGLTGIANAANEGFGAAANLGARLALEAGAQAVLFLNNDAALQGPCLEQLVDVLAANPRVGMIGPRVLQTQDGGRGPARVWAAGGLVAFGPNLSHLRGHGRLDGPPWQATCAVDYVPGCALLARAEVLEQVGLFDEAYFAYLEDVELGERVRAAGWQQLCLGDAVCLHAGSSATGGGYTARRKYLNALGSLRFLRDHGTPARWMSFVLCDVLPLPLAFLAAVPRGRGTAVLAKALGLVHGLGGRRATAATLEPGGTPLW